MELRLDARHDAAVLARRYALRNRLQIRDFMAPKSAEAVHEALSQIPWGIVFNRGGAVVELSAPALARLSPADAARIGEEVQDGARRGFQFLYAYYPMLTAYFTPGSERLPILRVLDFMNSPAVLELVRRVTGLEAIRWADGQATRFAPGHFLKYHTDETPSQKRLAAYVLSMTKDWGRDWGGYLQFFDEKYDVEEALRPVFNAINIFTIPMDHSVSMVATYAPAGRSAVTGWFRGDDPPGPFAR